MRRARREAGYPITFVAGPAPGPLRVRPKLLELKERLESAGKLLIVSENDSLRANSCNSVQHFEDGKAKKGKKQKKVRDILTLIV
jgi:hypothetical protein